MKNNMIIGLIVILVVLVGFFFLASPKPKLPPDNTNTVQNTNVVDVTNNTNNWKTFSDSAKGISFKYPEGLGVKYFSEVDWPPQVQIISGPFECTNASEEDALAGTTNKKVINGREYCVTMVSKNVKDNIYTDYAYASSFGNKTLYFTFSIRFTRCSIFDTKNNNRNACETEQRNLNIDQIMDQVIQTATLN
ncbi:MAG: hypothetical protein M3Q34_02195 [bacterium]|nr:hypothetical protein [bacterium]